MSAELFFNQLMWRDVADTSIRTDADGRFCLNDLHRAAGGESKHQPAQFLRLDSTAALAAELSDMGNPISAIRGGAGQGTYVAKELVYAYAMWISPAFHLKVIRAYDAIVSKPAADPLAALNDPATMRGLLLTYSEKVLALESKVGVIAGPGRDLPFRGWLTVEVWRSTIYMAFSSRRI